MARIAIYGSCVTRDAFEVRSHSHEIVRYFARSSMISQCAAPVTYTDEQMGTEISEWARRIVAADFEKNVVDLIAGDRPDLVIIDLIDERLPILEGQDTIVTLSPYSQYAPYVRDLRATARRVEVADPTRDEAFKRAARVLTTKLASEVGAEKILLHRSLYSTRVNKGKSFSLKEKMASRRMNKLLKSWYDTIAATSGCRVVEVPRRVRVADAGHKWGLSPFHYIDTYYEHLMDEIDEMTGALV